MFNDRSVVLSIVVKVKSGKGCAKRGQRGCLIDCYIAWMVLYCHNNNKVLGEEGALRTVRYKYPTRQSPLGKIR